MAIFIYVYPEKITARGRSPQGKQENSRGILPVRLSAASPPVAQTLVVSSQHLTQSQENSRGI